MPVITKSIGSAGGRDYPTVTLWEADLDNGAVYTAGDSAVGEIYNDSTLTETPTLNGGGTLGLVAVTLQAAAGQGHTGIANGAEIAGSITCNGVAGIVYTLIGLRLNGGRYANIGITNMVTLRRCISHNYTTSASGNSAALFQGNNGGSTSSAAGPRLLDCMGWKMNQNGGGSRDCYGIFLADGTRYGQAWNCTLWSVTSNATGPLRLYFGNSANTSVKNCISMGLVNNGPAAVFGDFVGATMVQEYNLSEDATAAGTGSLINKTVANQFVSTAGGSEDLHLKAGSDAINAGNDYVTTPANVQFDIDGRDRDAFNDVWDIGAHEFVRYKSERMLLLMGVG